MPSPGSYKEFTETGNLGNGELSIRLHSEALQAYRQELAEAQGLSIEELHATSFTQQLGQVAVNKQIG